MLTNDPGNLTITAKERNTTATTVSDGFEQSNLASPEANKIAQAFLASTAAQETQTAVTEIPVLSNKEYKRLYENAFYCREVSDYSGSAAAWGAIADTLHPSAFLARCQQIRDLMLEGGEANKQKVQELISQLATELETFKEQGREFEVHPGQPAMPLSAAIVSEKLDVVALELKENHPEAALLIWEAVAENNVLRATPYGAVACYEMGSQYEKEKQYAKAAEKYSQVPVEQSVTYKNKQGEIVENKIGARCAYNAAWAYFKTENWQAAAEAFMSIPPQANLMRGEDEVVAACCMARMLNQKEAVPANGISWAKAVELFQKNNNLDKIKGDGEYLIDYARSLAGLSAENDPAATARVAELRDAALDVYLSIAEQDPRVHLAVQARIAAAELFLQKEDYRAGMLELRRAIEHCDQTEGRDGEIVDAEKVKLERALALKRLEEICNDPNAGEVAGVAKRLLQRYQNAP